MPERERVVLLLRYLKQVEVDGLPLADRSGDCLPTILLRVAEDLVAANERRMSSEEG